MVTRPQGSSSSQSKSRRWLALLLLLPFIVLLYPPFYNYSDPKFIGIPFFYWFQMALVIVCAAVTAVVYFATERAG